MPVLRTVPETAGVARAAMIALLEGPTANEAASDRSRPRSPTARPCSASRSGTAIATVDLSTEFDSGGGTASMQYRLAQVVYTLTQFSTIRSVVFQIDGADGDRVRRRGDRPRPARRRGSDYEDQLPAIFVDGPAYGAAFGNRWPRRRHRERVRGDLPGLDPRRRGQDARRRPGHGVVRHRLPRQLRLS